MDFVSNEKAIDLIKKAIKEVGITGYNPDETITTTELAERFRLAPRSASSQVSRFKNPSKYNPPLKHYKTSKEDTYLWRDCVEFREIHFSSKRPLIN